MTLRLREAEEAILMTIGLNCPELEELELDSAELSSGAFAPLLANCAKLDTLKLKRIRGVSNELWRLISAKSRSLKRLELWRCHDFVYDENMSKMSIVRTVVHK